VKTSSTHLAWAAALGLAVAASSSAQNAPPSGNGGKNAALDAAIQACSASVAKDAGGHPDRTAMDACMAAKGFTKPSGPPPGGAPQ
jgi:hypothetical protein